MQKLIIFPSFTLGPKEKQSDLDIYLLALNNIFDIYSNELRIQINTRNILYNYFSYKYNPDKEPDIIYNTHIFILMYIFMKIITAYDITDIYIYNSHFFDIFYHVFNNSPNLAKYNNKITLIVDVAIWHKEHDTQISKISIHKQFKNIVYINQLPQVPLNTLLYQPINIPTNLKETFNVTVGPKNILHPTVYNVECNIMYFEMLTAIDYRQHLAKYFDTVCSYILSNNKYYTVNSENLLHPNTTTNVSLKLGDTCLTLEFNFNVNIYLHTILPQNYLFIIDALDNAKNITTPKITQNGQEVCATISHNNIDILNDYLPIKYAMVDIQIELIKFKLLAQKLNLRHILNFNINYI